MLIDPTFWKLPGGQTISNILSKYLNITRIGFWVRCLWHLWQRLSLVVTMRVRACNMLLMQAKRKELHTSSSEQKKFCRFMPHQTCCNMIQSTFKRSATVFDEHWTYYVQWSSNMVAESLNVDSPNMCDRPILIVWPGLHVSWRSLKLGSSYWQLTL